MSAEWPQPRDGPYQELDLEVPELGSYSLFSHWSPPARLWPLLCPSQPKAPLSPVGNWCVGCDVFGLRLPPH